MSERLQAGLDKRDGVVLSNPETWKLLPHELAELSSSMYYIYCIRASLEEELKPKE